MGSLMGLIGSVIVVIAVLAQCTAAETTYIVGDSAGWTVRSYDSWLSGKTFAVGDKLSKHPPLPPFSSCCATRFCNSLSRVNHVGFFSPSHPERPQHRKENPHAWWE